MELPDLRYPIGKFSFPETVSVEERAKFVGEITEAPFKLREVVKGLDDAQLDTPYRPGGWTVRQVVHHVPDSHLNSYVRFRLALTEEEPTIKAYEEDRWAELPDARTAPVEISLRLLESLHSRWVGLLRSLTDEDWKRTFRHPSLGLLRLEQNAALYAWHGKHHVAHVAGLRRRQGW
ncbi:MAG TPA: bacillithiol transferase BstA [Bryobacteraceae bacterium]|nr:bacillithiol transferase BstA [Bryobacteraceae bacterium]